MDYFRTLVDYTFLKGLEVLSHPSTNFMQKIRKILRAVSEIFKDGPRTDHGRTDGRTDGHG